MIGEIFDVGSLLPSLLRPSFPRLRWKSRGIIFPIFRQLASSVSVRSFVRAKGAIREIKILVVGELELGTSRHPRSIII